MNHTCMHPRAQDMTDEALEALCRGGSTLLQVANLTTDTQLGTCSMLHVSRPSDREPIHDHTCSTTA